MTSSSQLQDLDQYLARRRFVPNPGNSNWLDRDKRAADHRGPPRARRDPLCRTAGPHRSCLYEAVFSPGTPDAVIIAAIEAALSPPLPQAGQSSTR